jgi:ATP-dependent Zn protease
MALVKPTDDKALSTKRYAWQDEETLVERRKRLPYRILRFVRWAWWRAILVGLVLWALFDATVMQSIINIAPVLLRLVMIATLSIGQLFLIFWFLGRPRQYTIMPGAEGVSFKDYRGQPELLEQARQVVKLLRGVKAFEQAGGEPLSGMLFEGPPGTGKTWLAQAISTEAGVPFFYLDASSLQSMFFGISPLKVGRLYAQARKAARQYGAAVIFMDEIDAIGSRAGVSGGDPGVRGYQPNRLPIMFMPGGGNVALLNALLSQMSGFSLEHGWWARKRTWFYKNVLRRMPPKPEKRVLTIGATNRMHALDAALLRPGRFDKKIRIDAPDLEGRRDIIEYYLSKMSHDETIDPLILASETPYYTPADLKYLLNEALRYALFDGRIAMSIRDIRLAQPEHEMGIRNPIKNLSPEAKRRLAAHEAGHAIAIRLFRPSYRISRITIVRQGFAYGHVSSYPAQEEYDYMSSYEQLVNRLRVAVAGKAGEMEYCGVGEQTLGVGGDFANIRAVLAAMADAGMFGALGDGSSPTHETREAMEEMFRMVLDEVRMAFRMHRDMAEELIKVLQVKNEMLADEVETFFDQYGLYTPKVELRREAPADVVEGEVV